MSNSFLVWPPPRLFGVDTRLILSDVLNVYREKKRFGRISDAKFDDLPCRSKLFIIDDTRVQISYLTKLTTLKGLEITQT